jgi:hypothetical protein
LILFYSSIAVIPLQRGDAKKEKKENYKIMKIASDRNALKLHLFRLMEVWGFEGGVGVVVAMAGSFAETSACVYL